MNTAQLQCNEDGSLRHFLTIEGLDRATLVQVLDTAESFISVGEREIKKVPLLRGKTVVNLFFESSTRTRTTFEIAAKRLSADVINLNPTRLSTSKGETVLDTVKNLEAMHTDLFVVRDSFSGAAYLVAQHVPPHVSIINGGDGRHAHPTQAMLDMFTIRRHKGDIALPDPRLEHPRLSGGTGDRSHDPAAHRSRAPRGAAVHRHEGRTEGRRCGDDAAAAT